MNRVLAGSFRFICVPEADDLAQPLAGVEGRVRVRHLIGSKRLWRVWAAAEPLSDLSTSDFLTRRYGRRFSRADSSMLSESAKFL